MAKTTEQLSDLEPATTTEATIEQHGDMLEITPTTPPKARRNMKKEQPLIEIDPDAITAAQQALQAESGNSTSANETSSEVESGNSTSANETSSEAEIKPASTAYVVPEPIMNPIREHISAPQATQGEVSRASAVMPNQRLINADFVQKTKAINSVPREVIEQRLDEIDAMFSLRRNSVGATRDNATIMLAMALWEIMGL